MSRACSSCASAATPHGRVEVDFAPPHPGSFVAALPEQQPQPDGVGCGAGLCVEARPQRAELVIGEHARAGAFGEALDHPRRRMRVDERAVERDGEDPRDERLHAVDADRQAFARDRVEQFVDVRPRDAAQRQRAPGRQQIAVDLRRVVATSLQRPF